MGKGALLIALVATITFSFANITREESAMNRSLVDSDYQDAVVSRETAKSAYNIVVSQVKADFQNYRGSTTDKIYAAAGFEYSAVDGATADQVIVTAKGMLNNHEYEITGTITKSESRILDAMTIDADIKESKNKYEVEISNKALISGHDTNPDGSAGKEASVYGMLVTTEQTLKSIKTGTGSSKIIGKQPKDKNKSQNKSMFVGLPVKNLQTLATEIEAYSGADLVEYVGKQKWDKQTVIGSSAKPKVILVDGNVELKDDAVGYGILYVHGNFKMSGNSKWYGVVYQYADGGKFETDGTAAIYGATIARSIKGDPKNGGDGLPDRGLPGGHFDVDVFDTPNSVNEVYHEHRYDDKFDVTGTNLLFAGCKNQGLCWDQIMGAYAGNQVEIQFANTSAASGTYLITAGGKNYAGSSRKGFKSLRVDPGTITAFATNFANLCELRPTEPKLVQGDAKNRNGAFTIKIFGVDVTTGKTGALVYELAMYHHWKPEDGKCNPNPKDPNAPVVADAPQPGKGMTFKIKGNSRLIYSSALLTQMNGLVSEFTVEAGGFVEKRQLETPLRVGRILSLRDRYAMTKDEYLAKESEYLSMLKSATVDLRQTTTLK